MLIENWREAWKMLSVQIQAIWGAACAVYIAMPPDQQKLLLAACGITPEGVAAAVFVAQVSAALAATTIAARVVAQPSLRPKAATSGDEGPDR